MAKRITTTKAEDINKILSGQVIISLETCVKELIENSLDAGSRNIDIYFKNKGLDLVEVSDDGLGISKDDFHRLASKSLTSKITEFSDILVVTTYGFRGEAISSICAVSEVKVTTSTAEIAPRAFELLYDHRGELANESTVTRSRGTTVSVSNLFAGMPVRRKIFEKQIKREFSKTLGLIQAYCIISEGVKISVYGLKKSKSLLFGTKGSSLKDNVINIYGSTVMKSLVPVDFELNIHDRKSSSADGNASETSLQFTGYLSDVSVGFGRGSTDKQLTYINARPSTLPQVCRWINEIYRSFNNLQYPVIVLNIKIDPQLLDINITPDKRVIHIQHEDVMQELLKEKLNDIFQGKSHLVPVGSLPKRVAHEEYLLVSVDNLEPKNVVMKPDILSTQEKLSLLNKELVNEDEKEKIHKNDESISEVNDEALVSEVEQKQIEARESESSVNEILVEEVSTDLPATSSRKISHVSVLQESVFDSPDDISASSVDSPESKSKVILCEDSKTGNSQLQDTTETTTITSQSPLLSNPTVEAKSDFESIPAKISPASIDKGNASESKTNQISRSSVVSENPTLNLQVNVRASLSELKPCFKFLKSRPFLAAIEADIDDVNSADAESTLTLSIKKSDFLDMTIAGQFNLGFILVKKPDNNLFIVDQHASDEKYNFEKLNREHVFASQRLISPKDLNLSPVESLIVLDHISVFERNGFIIQYDQTLKKLCLEAVPISKGTIFDESDFDELLALVKENEGSNEASFLGLRCSKIRAVLASRACRSSIMIGKALTQKTMKKVVRNLSGLDKPWNCPHGRPTMRHLSKLGHESFQDDYQI